MSENTQANETPKSSGQVAQSANAAVGNKSMAPQTRASQPLVKETAKPTAPADITAQNLVDQLKALGDTNALNVLDGIVSYMRVMAPGKAITPTDGARQQVILYRTLQNAINGVQPNFRLLFATILKLIDGDSKGAFSGTHAFRFTDMMVLSAEDRQGFMRLMNLLLTGAAVDGRQAAMRHVDFQRSLTYGVTDEGRARILSFFGR